MTRPRPAPEDLEILVPQHQAARDILRRWRLGDSLDDLAAILVLKIVAITWRQVSSALSPEERNLMELRLYLSDKSFRVVGARVEADTGGASLIVDWPEDLDGKSVIGFTLAASADPLVLASGDTLVLPLPPVIGIES